MTDAGQKVLAGFIRLSDSDRSGVIEAMNRYLEATPAKRTELRQEYEKAVMGPVSSSCPCCRR
jgi:CHASE1-domain containing sensor protein